MAPFCRVAYSGTMGHASGWYLRGAMEIQNNITIQQLRDPQGHQDCPQKPIGTDANEDR